jgi:hypothetical protein
MARGRTVGRNDKVGGGFFQRMIPPGLKIKCGSRTQELKLRTVSRILAGHEPAGLFSSRSHRVCAAPVVNVSSTSSPRNVVLNGNSTTFNDDL